MVHSPLFWDNLKGMGGPGEGIKQIRFQNVRPSPWEDSAAADRVAARKKITAHVGRVVSGAS